MDSTTSFAYDAHQNLSSVTYPDLSVRTYLYESSVFPHAVTGIQDENASRYSTYGYDGFGHANASGLAGGADQVNVVYNADGSQTVTDALGTARTYVLDVVQGVVVTRSVSQPCEKCPGVTPKLQTFDANANVASRLDFNNNLACYAYDLARNLETQRVEGLSGSACPGSAVAGVTRTVTTEWDTTYRLPHRIAEPLRITTLSYDTHGNVLSETVQSTADASGAQGLSATPTGTPRTWTYTYTYSATIPGQVVHLVVDGPRTDVVDLTTYDWNAQGNLTTITNALGHVITLGNYDAHGRARLITDANGLTTTLAYDLRGRLTARNVGGETTAFTYDPAGQLTRLTQPDGSFISYTYDAAHRLTQIQDNLGNKIAYTLDAMGNRTQEQVYDPSNTLAQARSRVYNSLNRLIQDIGGANPATEITQYGYDTQGNLTSITDPLSHATLNAYDALNRVAMVTDPASGITRYGYDGLDQIASVADPRNLSTSYTQDGLGNLTSTSSPDAGASSATFDAAGNAITRTDAKGQTATYQYDALNRITQIAWTDGQVWGYGYDAGQNGIGRLTSLNDPSGTTTLTYDSHGRVTQKQQVVLSYSSSYSPLTLTTSYAYNAVGQLVSQTYPSGKLVTYTWSNGQLTAVAINGSAAVSNVVYRPFGPPQQWSFGSGRAVNRSFDLDGRMTSNPIGSVVYDAASRVTQAYGHTYGYDVLDRLTSMDPSGISPESYSYDANGNRVSQLIGTTLRTYSISPTSNQIVSSTSNSITRTYVYDANGSITSNGVLSMAYDGAGRLSSAQGSPHYYNALGQRTLTKIANNMPRWYVYDQCGNLLGTYFRFLSGYYETVYLGDLPIAVMDQVNGVKYADTDHLGSVRAISDSAQRTIYAWNPGTFGTAPPSTDPDGDHQSFNYYGRFPGQYYSSESTLHLNYYRDYDPQTGRYVESDPIGIVGGPNLYGYVGGNPVSYVDPKGLLLFGLHVFSRDMSMRDAAMAGATGTAAAEVAGATAPVAGVGGVVYVEVVGPAIAAAMPGYGFFSRFIIKRIISAMIRGPKTECPIPPEVPAPPVTSPPAVTAPPPPGYPPPPLDPPIIIP